MVLSLHYQHIYWTLKRYLGESLALGSSSGRTGLGQEAHGTGEKGGEGEKGKEEENMREQDAQELEGQRERNERDILIEGAIKGLIRNMALWKFPGILKDNPN